MDETKFPLSQPQKASLAGFCKRHSSCAISLYEKGEFDPLLSRAAVRIAFTVIFILRNHTFRFGRRALSPHPPHPQKLRSMHVRGDEGLCSPPNNRRTDVSGPIRTEDPSTN